MAEEVQGAAILIDGHNVELNIQGSEVNVVGGDQVDGNEQNTNAGAGQERTGLGTRSATLAEGETITQSFTDCDVTAVGGDLIRGNIYNHHHHYYNRPPGDNLPIQTPGTGHRLGLQPDSIASSSLAGDWFDGAAACENRSKPPIPRPRTKTKGTRLESDGYEDLDISGGSFSKDLPSGDKKDVKKLTDSIFMFTDQPLHPGTRVYRGQQIHVGGRIRDLAIKILLQNTRSEKEVDLLLLVEHPNIVRVIETGQCIGIVPEIFIAMELCAKNLQEYVNENKQKPFDFEKSFSFTEQFFIAVAFLHSRNIVHRDLKPGNVLISKDAKIKVADLGLSRDIPEGKDAAPVTNINAGSEGFKAPEIYKGVSDYSYSADIFAAGIIVNFIFTNGKHPFGDKPYKLAGNITGNKNRDLSSIPRFKPPYTEKRTQLIKLIKRMLEHDPDKRPTAEQILKDLFFKSGNTFAGSTSLFEKIFHKRTVSAELQGTVNVTSQDERKFGKLAVSAESQGNTIRTKSEKEARIKHLERELDQPSKNIGYERCAAFLEELRSLRRSDDIDSLLRLAECHLRLKDDKMTSSMANVSKFITSSGTYSDDDLRKMGDKLRDEGKSVQSMIAFKIRHDLQMTKELPAGEMLSQITINVDGITLSIERLTDNESESRDIAIECGIAWIEKFFADFQSIPTQPRDRDFADYCELSCLGDIIASYNRAGNFVKSIEFGESGLKKLKEKFNSPNTLVESQQRLVGNLYHNLGIAYGESGEFAKAENYFHSSLESYKKANADNFSNEEKRQELIKIATEILEYTRRNFGYSSKNE